MQWRSERRAQMQSYVNQTELTSELTSSSNAITSLLLSGTFVRRTTDLEKTANIYMNWLPFSLSVTASADASLVTFGCRRRRVLGDGDVWVTFGRKRRRVLGDVWIWMTFGCTINYLLYDAIHEKNQSSQESNPPKIPQKPNFIIILECMDLECKLVFMNWNCYEQRFYNYRVTCVETVIKRSIQCA